MSDQKTITELEDAIAHWGQQRVEAAHLLWAAQPDHARQLERSLVSFPIASSGRLTIGSDLLGEVCNEPIQNRAALQVG